jgi:hypothetical protein
MQNAEPKADPFSRSSFCVLPSPFLWFFLLNVVVPDDSLDILVRIRNDASGAHEAKAALQSLTQEGLAAIDPLKKAFDDLEDCGRHQELILRTLGSQLGELGHIAGAGPIAPAISEFRAQLRQVREEFEQTARAAADSWAEQIKALQAARRALQELRRDQADLAPGIASDPGRRSESPSDHGEHLRRAANTQAAGIGDQAMLDTLFRLCAGAEDPRSVQNLCRKQSERDRIMQQVNDKIAAGDIRQQQILDKYLRNQEIILQRLQQANDRLEHLGHQ